METDQSQSQEDSGNVEMEDELTRRRREFSELRTENAKTKEQIASASARFRAAANAMEFVRQQRQQLESESKANFNGSGKTGPGFLEAVTWLPSMLQRQRSRLDSYEAELEEAWCIESILRDRVLSLSAETEDLKRQLAESHSLVENFKWQLHVCHDREASLRNSLEGDLLRLRAELEARQTMPAISSSSPQQQPEKVIIMTSSSMRTLDTEKPTDQSIRASGNTPAMITAASLQSPRAMLTASALPVRQCSAGTGSLIRQQVPLSCSSVPLFRQVSNDMRPLGSPQSSGVDGTFNMNKETNVGQPPPGQVFRRYSGNSGVTSPRPGTGGARTTNLSCGSGNIPAAPLSAGRVSGISGLRGATEGQSPIPSISTPLGQAMQGRITPQRLGAPHSGAVPSWGFQVGTGTMPSMVLGSQGNLPWLDVRHLNGAQ